MSIPTKPKGVPTLAKWDNKLQLWAKGDLQDKKQVGEWKWWRKRGGLYCEATFNKKGQRHGEYYRYHTNGKIYEHATYENGVLNGTQTLQNTSGNSDLRLPRDFHWQIHKIEFEFKNGFLLETKLYNHNGSLWATAPKNVPKNAIYNSYSRWEFGEKRRNKKIRTWKTWRNDGTLFSQMEYNDQGVLHGHYKIYHPNGETAKAFTYQNGKAHGICYFFRPKDKSKTDQSFPHRVSTSVHSMEQHFNRGSIREEKYFKEDGSPCNYRGLPLPKEAIDKSFGGKPVNFLDSGFPKYMELAYPKKNQANIGQVKAHFQALWGMAMPEDLAKALDELQQSDFPKIINWETAPIPLADIHDEELNIVEEAILNMQRVFPADNIVDWFTGSVCLDKMFYKRYSQSSSFQYGLYDTVLTSATDNQIYRFDFNSPDRYWGMSFQDPMAKDLSSLLMIYGGADAFDRHGLISDKTFYKVFDKTKSLVQGDYRMFSDIYTNNNRFRYYDMRYRNNRKPSYQFFEKSRWLLDLLRYNDERPSSYSVNKSSYYDTKSVKTVVPKAIYNLFASYFRKDDKHNDVFIKKAKESSSRIIRDAALLVEEFRNGRNELGLIKDLEAIRN